MLYSTLYNKAPVYNSYLLLSHALTDTQFQ